jgi:hypothetical protein
MVTRRDVIHAVAAGSTGAIAGCSGLRSETVPVEIAVINNNAETHQFHLRIAEPGDRAIVDTRLEVRPSGSAHRDKPYRPSTTISGLFTFGAEYEFSVEVQGMASRTTRVMVDCQEDEGEQWSARLRSGGGILVHDSSC